LLTDSYLLTKVKELGDVSKSDLVRACGYVNNKMTAVNDRCPHPSMCAPPNKG
jgi:hypothetical protein